MFDKKGVIYDIEHGGDHDGDDRIDENTETTRTVDVRRFQQDHDGKANGNYRQVSGNRIVVGTDLK